MVHPRNKRLKTVGLENEYDAKRSFGHSTEVIRDDEDTHEPPRKMRLWVPSPSEAAVSISSFDNRWRVGGSTSFSGRSSDPSSEFADEYSSHHENEGFKTAPVKIPGDNGRKLPFAVESVARLPPRKIPGIVETNNSDAKWNRMFAMLQEHMTQDEKPNGSSNPQCDDSTLVDWIHYQRVQYWLFHHHGHGRISQTEINKLNSINFDWDIHQQRSTRRLSGKTIPASSASVKPAKQKATGSKPDKPKKQRARDKTSAPSASSGDQDTDPDTEKLKTKQRRPEVIEAVNVGESLPPDHVAGIDESNAHDKKWNSMFTVLQNYKSAFGNCNVPQISDFDEKLGRWVHYQRVEYWLFQHQGHGKISEKRIVKLDSIGFDWDPQQTQWASMYERLCAYKEATGHTSVVKSNSNDHELINWVRNQRLEHSYRFRGKKSRMTNERKLLLDALDFQFSSSSG